MQFQKTVIIQSQKQKLSPQMIQAIHLMSLPLQDLKEEIQTQIETNPALEIINDDSTMSLDTYPESHDAEYETENLFENSSDSGYADDSQGDSKRMFLEGAITMSETLQEHLLWQFRLQPVTVSQRTVGEKLIQNLDSDGFNKENPYVLCNEFDEDFVDSVIEIIHHLEPIGVCVKDYRESLLVQAKQAIKCPKGTILLLENYVDLLEKGKHLEIQKLLSISDSGMSKILAFLKQLNPFPGRQYSAEETVFVVPDAQVKLVDGEFIIKINEEEIPLIGINPFFEELSEKKQDNQTDEFVKDNIQKAKFFIQSIQQRNRTLLKVLKAVVEFQRQFFARGPKFLAPLTLKDIANQIGVHEATISRIAGKKYVQTDWGIFELKHFFTNSITGSGSVGSRFSKGGVKQVIREIIENETSSMSDQDITDILARKGIQLARRTVAKYRKELNMDSSFGRKHN